MYPLTRRLPFLSENQTQTMENARKYSGNTHIVQQTKLLNRRVEITPPKLPGVRPKNWFAPSEPIHPTQLKKPVVEDSKEQYQHDDYRTSRPLELQLDDICIRNAKSDEDRWVTHPTSRHLHTGGSSDYSGIAIRNYRDEKSGYAGERAGHDGLVWDCHQQWECHALKLSGKLPPIQEKITSKKRRTKRGIQKKGSELTLPRLTNVDMPPYRYWQP